MKALISVFRLFIFCPKPLVLFIINFSDANIFFFPFSATFLCICFYLFCFVNIGATLVPAAATGHLAGGFIITKFKWTTSQIIIYTLVCCTIAAGLSPAILISCDSAPVAGVTSNYRYFSNCFYGSKFVTSTNNKVTFFFV